MSYSGFDVAALNFNGGAGLPYAIFTPVEWAPLNSSGVSAPSSNDTASAGSVGVNDYGTGITPGLLAAAQDNLAGISYTGLNSVAAGGLNSQALIGSLFSSWGSTLQQIAQQNANAFSQTVSNENNARTSGLLSGIGGLFGGVAKGVAGVAAFL